MMWSDGAVEHWMRNERVSLHNPGERGDTLLEVLITLIILSITVSAVLIAFSESIGGSATHRTLVANDVALRTVAESVYAEVAKQNNPLYNPCATYYGSLSPSAQFGTPTGYQSSVTVVGYFYELSNIYGWQSTPLDCLTPVPEQLLITLITPKGVQLDTTIVVDGQPSS